jgi:hypothetical protein
MASIDDKIIENFKRDMKISTFKNYMVRLETTQKLMNGKGLVYIMTHPLEVHKELVKKFGTNTASIGNYITPINKLFSTNVHLMAKYEKKYQTWKELLKNARDQELFRYKLNKPTEKQIANRVDYNEVLEKFQELSKINEKDIFSDPKNNLEFLLLAVLIHIRPKRADLGNVGIYKKNPSVGKHTPNYIVLNGSPRLVVSKHKTDAVHKTIQEDIPNELFDIIIKSLQYYPRKFLFVDSKGNPYIQNNSYAEYVKRVFYKHFGKNTGVSLWRHIFVSARINASVLNEHQLEHEAKLMGHSVNQQRIVYTWKENDQVCTTVCKKS